MSTAANYAFLTLFSVVMLAPFLWMISSAFKPAAEIVAYPPIWITAHPTFNNLRRAWTEVSFARYTLNSAIVAISNTLIVMSTSAFVGYVLAKFQFRGRNLFLIAILATMMIPWPITILPSYQLIAWMTLMNTYWALIIPTS
jgi:multiple sugar transport system permease protein